MRRTNVVKILGIILLLLSLSLICSNSVQASEASLSVTNCNVGENFTVTVNMPGDVVGYEGNVSITYSNGNTVSLDKMLASPSPSNIVYTGNYSNSFNAATAGQAVVSISNLKLYNKEAYDNLTSVDSDFSPMNSISSLSQTITISDPSAAQQPDSGSGTTNEPQTPEPSVTLNFKENNETMYTNRRVNVRQNYGTDSNIIQTLSVGTEVTRTGISDGTKNGYSWSRISYNGITGYVITAALTSEAPAPEVPEEKPEEEIPEENENPEEIPEESKTEIDTISEKLGAIPEVGVNIMPFMFLGSCVVCMLLAIGAKRNLIK